MREGEAVKVASEYAKQHGYDPVHYRILAVRKNGKWEVHFERNGESSKPRPGDFFTIYVDHRTKVVERMIHGQ
jgi:hypothetical protein